MKWYGMNSYNAVIVGYQMRTIIHHMRMLFIVGQAAPHDKVVCIVLMQCQQSYKNYCKNSSDMKNRSKEEGLRL